MIKEILVLNLVINGIPSILDGNNGLNKVMNKF